MTWAVETGIPELRRLVEADAYADAFAMATRVARALPNDTTLRELWPRLTQIVSVTTTPDDAVVSFRSASAGNSEWDVLGRSPLPERRVPYGAFWMRVEKPGFHPSEMMFLGIAAYDSPDQARAITIVLEATGTRTVAVPEGRLGLDLYSFETVEPIDLPAFRIDQFEVTNQEYADAAPLFLAVERRWRAAVLLDGGFDPVPTRPEIRQSGYAPRVRIPVLMINGSFDASYQIEASQKPLFTLLGTPAADKRHVVYPTGHSVFTGYRNQAIRNILDWLDRYQGPVQ